MTGRVELGKGRRAAAGEPNGEQPPRRPSVGGDARAVLSAVALIGAAAITGALLNLTGHNTTLGVPPLSASFHPQVGPGTAPAILLAASAAVLAPRLVLRLRWSRLLVVAGAAAFTWTASLALVDGWQGGWAGRLSAPNEYLFDLPRITSVREFLAGFSSHIVDHQPGSWAVHVSGHPPLATLLFWALDRIGLSGGGGAGFLVIAAGASTPVAIAITFRALGAEAIGRRMLPALVFFPGAVWVGVSADGLFAAVAAWSVALLAAALRRRSTRALLLGFGSGLLFGATVYLSYGLALIGLLLAAVLLAGGRDVPISRWRIGICVGLGFAAVAITFSVAGFEWFTGLAQLKIRYHQGIAEQRAYGYFVWANVAALAVVAGPAAAAGVVRAGRMSSAWWPIRRWQRPNDSASAPALLVVAALAAVVLADITGLSKAETERIWLPFAVWIVAGIGLLPARSRRWALISQIVLALLLNHLIADQW